MRGQKIVRVKLAVALLVAGSPIPDKSKMVTPDERGCLAPTAWGLGVRTTTSILTNFILRNYQRHLVWVEKHRRREVSFDGGQSKEGGVVPCMEVRITLTL